LGPVVAGFTAAAGAGTTFTFESTLVGLVAAALTETAFAAAAGDALFAPAEIVFALGPATAGFPEAVAEAAFAVDTVGLPETAFGVEVEGFVADVAFTETATFDFGVALVALAFAPFGEGFPACAVWFVAGCTLTVAGAAGVCTAVGVCAKAAADRSMSVPRVRII
jgi:hypothetical protein